MSFKPDMNIPENREYWDHAKKCSKLVERWPDWMKGGNLTKYKDPKQENNVRKTSASHASKNR